MLRDRGGGHGSENALTIRTKISFLILSGCRAGASPASCTKRQPERLPYKQNAFACVLNDAWRGMSEKAPLQDPLSKGVRAGRPRVQQERCECIAEMCERPALLEAKMDIGKIAVTSCPTLGDSWNNGTQDFAALHLRRLFFLLFRFGMNGQAGCTESPLLPSPRTHNDLRSQSRNRSQSQRPRSAYSLSCLDVGFGVRGHVRA